MKKPIDPPPFCVIIDTREQNPLPFAEGVPTRRDTLYPGDYSVDGLRSRIVVEKKDMGDLIGTLFGYSPKADGGRMPRLQKFVEELTAMRPIPLKAVVVTQPLRMIEQHLYQSTVPPQNVIRLIHDIEAQTGVPFKFFDTAAQAAYWVASEFFQAWEVENGLSSIKYTVRKLRPERLVAKIPEPPPKASKRKFVTAHKGEEVIAP